MKSILTLLIAVTLLESVGLAGVDPAQPTNELDALAGVADFRRSNNLPFGSLELRFAENWEGLHPYALVGAEGGGSLIGAGGLLYNIQLPDKLRDVRFTLGTGPGIYHHDGSSTDLGDSVEFYSWAELSTKVYGRRIGVSLSHISNAHLSRHNPGIDGVNVTATLASW